MRGRCRRALARRTARPDAHNGHVRRARAGSRIEASDAYREMDAHRQQLLQTNKALVAAAEAREREHAAAVEQLESDIRVLK